MRPDDLDPLDAFVVGGMDLGESDRIVRLLTPTEGRTAVVARGYRGSKRRFAGVGELGVHLRVRRGRTSGTLPPLATVDLLRGPDRARRDLDRIGLLAYGCEVCAALAPEGDAAPKLFGLLGAWLDALEAERSPDDAARIALEAKALTFAGLTPALVRCARCGEALEDPVVFDPEAGGGLHARCGAGRAVPARALLHAEVFRREPLAGAVGAPVPPEVRWLLADFVQHQLGRPLPSRAWFTAIG